MVTKVLSECACLLPHKQLLTHQRICWVAERECRAREGNRDVQGDKSSGQRLQLQSLEHAGTNNADSVTRIRFAGKRHAANRRS